MLWQAVDSWTGMPHALTHMLHSYSAIVAAEVGALANQAEYKICLKSEHLVPASCSNLRINNKLNAKR